MFFDVASNILTIVLLVLLACAAILAALIFVLKVRLPPDVQVDDSKLPKRSRGSLINTLVRGFSVDMGREEVLTEHVAEIAVDKKIVEKH